MKICIRMSSDKPIVLNANYNRVLQAFIYNNISENDLHDKGYKINGRNFKLFTFSQIFGVYKFIKKDKKIVFTDEIRFIVSSADEDFVNELVKNLLTSEELKLGENTVKIIGVNKVDELFEGNKIVVKTISPAVAYSTEIRGDKKFTRYLPPEDENFIRIVRENLLKKCKLLGVGNSEDVQITHLGDSKKIVTSFKGTIIEAYLGTFLLEGDKEILNVALSCGIGSKSSQGFGCIELRGEIYDRSDS